MPTYLAALLLLTSPLPLRPGPDPAPAPGSALATALEPGLASYAAPSDYVRLSLSGYTAAHQASRTTVLAPALAMQHEVAPHWVVAGEWGAVRLSESSQPADTSITKLGNLALSVRSLFDAPSLHAEIGMGVALPFARPADGESGRQAARAYSFVSGVHGLSALWLWAPNRFSVLTPFALEAMTWRLLLHVDGALALLVPTGGQERRNDALLDLGVEVKTATFVQIGGRLESVFIPTQPRDRLQLAGGPILEVVTHGEPDATGARSNVRLRLEAAFPFGAPLSSFRLWSVTLGCAVGI